MEAVWALAGINSGDLADIVQQDKIIPGFWRRCTCQIVLLHGVWVDYAPHLDTLQSQYLSFRRTGSLRISAYLNHSPASVSTTITKAAIAMPASQRPILPRPPQTAVSPEGEDPGGGPPGTQHQQLPRARKNIKAACETCRKSKVKYASPDKYAEAGIHVGRSSLLTRIYLRTGVQASARTARVAWREAWSASTSPTTPRPKCRPSSASTTSRSTRT